MIAYPGLFGSVGDQHPRTFDVSPGFNSSERAGLFVALVVARIREVVFLLRRIACASEGHLHAASFFMNISRSWIAGDGSDLALSLLMAVMAKMETPTSSAFIRHLRTAVLADV